MNLIINALSFAELFEKNICMKIVELADYNIYIGSFSQSLRQLLERRNYSKIFVIVDENTAIHCLPLVEAALPNHKLHKIQIQSGEKNKNINTCQLIWQSMMEAEADRKSLTINLGGGVIGDMGGFCASTFKRGMDFIQIPTTLLSQVDASIGGKLGIDFMQVKNSIGLFNNPQAVFVDATFLKTLSKREIRSGFAELIKHSLIADIEQWQEIRSIDELDGVNWEALIEPSLQIKKRIVEEDPFEKGIRKALNFGHTIGHAIEGHVLESDQPLLHGEAIAIGMICEAYLSHKILKLPVEEVKKISKFILNTYNHYPLQNSDFDTFIQLMGNDKKNEGGKINFSLINEPGQVKVNQTCEPTLIEESLVFYQQLSEKE